MVARAFSPSARGRMAKNVAEPVIAVDGSTVVIGGAVGGTGSTAGRGRLTPGAGRASENLMEAGERPIPGERSLKG